MSIANQPSSGSLPQATPAQPSRTGNHCGVATNNRRLEEPVS